MSAPYRTPKEIAKDIPAMPKKCGPMPKWLASLLLLLASPVAAGIAIDASAIGRGTTVGLVFASSFVGIAALVRIFHHLGAFN